MPDWFEDEAFWIDFYSFMFPPERIAKAAAEVDAVLALTGLRPGRVLDLSCGPGRHAVEFARRGFQVTGVDLSAYLLNVAASRAEAIPVEVEFVREDIRTFARPETYRLVVSLFSSFGYFADREQDLHVLRNVYQSLAPGGSFVLDLVGKENAVRRYQPAIVHALDDGSTLFEKIVIHDDWSRVRTEWFLIRGENVRRHTFALNLYSAQEMKQALRDAGFQDVTVYGDLAGHPYGVDAERLVAVAVKPKGRNA
jgi:SAM-dependent methyltransferase